MRPIRFIISVITILLCCTAASAQRSLHPVDTYTYFSYDYDSDHTDTSKIFVSHLKSQLLIRDGKTVENPIPGFSEEFTYVDYTTDSIYYQYKYTDSTYYVASTMIRTDIKWDTQRINAKTTKYITSINSNRIELIFSTKEGADINPLPYYGKFKGVLKQMIRNGLVQLEFSLKVPGEIKMKQLIPDYLGIRKTGREMSIIKRERMVLTTHVFENEQICWGKEKPTLTDIPFDTTLHYAGGTLILKRIMLPKLPAHYQTFVELHQRSNGDAYDRTGSVFIIPYASNPIDNLFQPSFLDAIIGHPDSLPTFVGKDGQRYQGIIPGISRMKKYYYSSCLYWPLVELMRFFTPFGVGHFNDRIRLEGLEWKDETFYKQEVTDLQTLLQGEVWIGVFIGNYDAGGHIVSLDIKSYPNSYEWDLDNTTQSNFWVTPLVNTCNVLEMAGQNYGKIFGTDSITVSFEVNSWDSVLALRYISTGHGGWGGGDEFNPKENVILVDGERRFSHTPWRCDCARYREWNPVSGNFWNGISSSDLSRSGWCPGTATQPVYFDLTGLEPGIHKITIAIPQGKPMDGGFSHWNVSAQLIRQFRKPKQGNK